MIDLQPGTPEFVVTFDQLKVRIDGLAQITAELNAIHDNALSLEDARSKLAVEIDRVKERRQSYEKDVAFLLLLAKRPESKKAGKSSAADKGKDK